LLKKLTKKREYHHTKYGCYEISSTANLNDLIVDIYKKQIKRFKEKEYLTIEAIKYKGARIRILKIRKEIYKELDQKNKECLSVSVNQKFHKMELANLLKSKSDYIVLEMKSDFALPYLPFNSPKVKFNDLDFVQINLRPMKNSWKKELVSLQKGLESGYDETLRWDGCIGGFVGVFYPVVKLRDSSKSTKKLDKWGNYEIAIPKSKFVNRKFEQKYSLIEKKKSEIGFDVSIKMVISENDSATRLGKVMNTLNTNIEEFSNSFVISENKRFSTHLLGKINKGYMPEKCIDLLNEKEISEVINRLIV
ncbi:MAG: hypothetical protein WCO33_00730, partial [bacterium]